MWSKCRWYATYFFHGANHAKYTKVIWLFLLMMQNLLKPNHRHQLAGLAQNHQRRYLVWPLIVSFFSSMFYSGILHSRALLGIFGLVMVYFIITSKIFCYGSIDPSHDWMAMWISCETSCIHMSLIMVVWSMTFYISFVFLYWNAIVIPVIINNIVMLH